MLFEKKMIFFDFWNKLDLNIFNKKNFEIMIFFHFFFVFSIFKKIRLKKKIKKKKKLHFWFLKQIRFEK